MRYQEVSDEGYAVAFAATCTAMPTSRGMMLGGICPRCTDPMSFPHVTTVFKTATVHGRQAPALDQEEIEILCTCSKSHPGRPKGEDGCGAYWNIKVTSTS